MGKKRRVFSANQKSKIALEALKERMTGSEIAAKFSVHPNQVSQWKKQALEGLPELFERGSAKKADAEEQTELIERLYRHIGQLQVELDWVKKKHDGLQ